MASGREPPTQVKRKADLCARCRNEGMQESPVLQTQLDPAELTDIADGTLRLLAATQKRLEQTMLKNRAFSPTLASEAVKLARGVAAAIKEIRVVRESIVSHVEDMSDEDMRKTFSEWFKTIPRNQQKELLEELVAFYRANKPGVSE
jgi:hypothetical protein